MATPPPGVYRIIQSGDYVQPEPQVLSIKDRDVTILPINALPEREQKWRLEPREENKEARAIQFPTNIWPSASLSYEGPHEEGKRIILGPLSPFPTRDWYIVPAPCIPGTRQLYSIRTPDKKLGIEISKLDIYPPQLHLVSGEGTLWAFELLSELK